MSKGLPLKFDSSLKREDSGSIVAAALLAGKEVDVEFELPNGKTVTHKAKAGFTVEQLKALVETDTGLPFAKIALFHNDKLMPDPLSVSDITDVSNTVKVKVAEK
jgi:hypothetical protein